MKDRTEGDEHDQSPLSADSSGSSISSKPKMPRKKMYRSCDKCRKSKRACDAEYTNLREAIINKVACSLCRKNKKLCTFDYLISTFEQGALGLPDLNIGSSSVHTEDEGARKRKRGTEIDGEQIAQENLLKLVALSNKQSVGYGATSSRISDDLDRVFLNNDLMNTYNGAAEQALRCWITNSNTPYLFETDNFHDPWTDKTLHWRVTALDWGLKEFARPSITLEYDKSVERTIQETFSSVMIAFAAQWPRHRRQIAKIEGDTEASEDRIRLELWKNARDKLLASADYPSFRIVLALIVFAWTEKPPSVPAEAHWMSESTTLVSPQEALLECSAVEPSAWQAPAAASSMMLATAGRKLLAFRNKLQSMSRKGIDPWSSRTNHMQSDAPATLLNPVTLQQQSMKATLLEKTFHNLFWLGVMIDTETAVLRKQPPVICDDDTDLLSQSSLPVFSFSQFSSEKIEPKPQKRKVWDELILTSSENLKNSFAKSWPSSEEAALRTLAFSAPVKVLLFRYIGRIQAAYWRHSESNKIEALIQQASAVVSHWEEVYEPFLESCIAQHAQLPLSIQSWYTLITAPWNLAVILLVEIVQSVDQAGMSDTVSKWLRAEDKSLGRLRQKACTQTYDLIQAVRRTEEAKHMKNRLFGGNCAAAYENQNGPKGMFEYIDRAGGTVLHSEPWAEIMVHSFSAVAKSEIRLLAGYSATFRWQELASAQNRAETCLWALYQLSDRSHLASLAYKETKALMDYASSTNHAMNFGPDTSGTTHFPNSQDSVAVQDTPSGQSGDTNLHVWDDSLATASKESDSEPEIPVSSMPSLHAGGFSAAQLFDKDIFYSSPLADFVTQ